MSLQRLGESQSAPKIDMKIDFENFGPISFGSIHLKPLTVLVGPNNSGKSYAAMMIHSIISTENQIKRSFDALVHGDPDSIKLFESHAGSLKKILDTSKGKDDLVIPTPIIKKIRSSVIQNLFAKMIESSISRNFGSPVRDLIRTKQKTAKITISNHNKLSMTITKKLNVKTYNTQHAKYTIETLRTYKLPHISSTTDNHSVISVGRDSVIDEHLRDDLSEYLTSMISKDMFNSDIPEDSFYFPAARSGILHGHKELVANIIQNTPFGGIESIHMPKLTGLVSDFISNIILIDNKPGSFYDLAEKLEKDLLHGHIKLHSVARESLPEIIYHSKYNKIPLHRTSSTISEIAPLSLYLKHIVRPGSLLIIEEPEAHLHPANQLIFAKYIVRMIRAGLNVLVTTHSVFLLEQLGKFMLTSKVQPNIRKKLGFAREDYLHPEEISPYVFVQDADEDNHIEPIETNNEEGISQEEFVKIIENLHSESIRLRRYLPEE